MPMNFTLFLDLEGCWLNAGTCLGPWQVWVTWLKAHLSAHPFRPREFLEFSSGLQKVSVLHTLTAGLLQIQSWSSRVGEKVHFLTY